MVVAWTDVAIEGVAFLIFLAVTAYVVHAGRRRGLPGRKGWMPLVLGLFLLVLYGGYDVADEFPATDWEPMLGPIDIQDTLQDAVLPSVAITLLAIGIVSFLDLPARLSNSEQELKQLTEHLEDQVHLATQHLAEANEELATSEERFRLISKATHDTVWDWDLVTDDVWWGKGMSTWFGWDPGELDPSPSSWTERIHPEDRERVVDGIHAAIEAGEERWQATYRFQRKDGSYAEVLDHGWIASDEEGEPVRAVGSMIDVAEQRAREEELADAQRRFQILVTSIDENFWIVDAKNLDNVYNSPGFEEIFGLAFEDLEEPTAWFDLIHPEDRAQAQKRMLEIFQEPTEGELQYRVVRPDGSVRWVDTVIRPVRDEGGRVAQVAGVTRDITDQIRAQEAREEALEHRAEAERLREVDAFKSRFLNTAAHELSTPLTPIKFQLAGLTSGLYGALSEEQGDAVEMIDRNFQRFTRLVTDLLDSTRLEAGRLSMRREEVGISTLVEEVAEDARGRAEADGLDLVCQVEDGCLAMVDRERIAQVLTNLLDNAIKFTPEGGTITLRAHRGEGTVEIAVEDTGVGMDKAQLARVFRPFEQVHEAKEIPRGTGLGLYICKGIVEQLDGKITLESDGPGQGCTVRITLPAA